MTVKVPKKPQQRSRAKTLLDAVEIKVTVKPDQELQALRASELTKTQRKFVFYIFLTQFISTCSTLELHYARD